MRVKVYGAQCAQSPIQSNQGHLSISKLKTNHWQRFLEKNLHLSSISRSRSGGMRNVSMCLLKRSTHFRKLSRMDHGLDMSTTIMARVWLILAGVRANWRRSDCSGSPPRIQTPHLVLSVGEQRNWENKVKNQNEALTTV